LPKVEKEAQKADIFRLTPLVKKVTFHLVQNGEWEIAVYFTC